MLKSLAQTAEYLNQHANAVVCCPAEGIWGLSCKATSKSALERILTIKARSANKGMIIAAHSYAQIAPLLPASFRDNPPIDSDIPTTFLVPTPILADMSEAHRELWGESLPLLTGGHSTIAVRIVKNGALQELATLTESPIVTTSANLSGEEPALTMNGLDPLIVAQTDCVVSSETDSRFRGKASRIIDWTDNKVIR